MVHGLSCSAACGNLPGPGLKPVSRALAGGFLTTAPPGNSLLLHFLSLRSKHPRSPREDEEAYHYRFLEKHCFIALFYYNRVL